jgi:hypothetical protein
VGVSILPRTASNFEMSAEWIFSSESSGESSLEDDLKHLSMSPSDLGKGSSSPPMDAIVSAQSSYDVAGNLKDLFVRTY